ncbi:hypothetical protein ACHAXA_010477 [Cyclostephanos tholiformis]|uniref:MaoC-like domain-containing protein n=1 Tax=Cyclostephanos tholiformis TaxID=382380 RepID=A0ABD3SGA9_9STRA
MSSSSSSSGPSMGVGDDVGNDAEKRSFVAYYTRRDVVLYALGIGCHGDHDDHDDHDDDDDEDGREVVVIDECHHRELRYVYEDHPYFMAFPTFPLSLPFVAESRDMAWDADVDRVLLHHRRGGGRRRSHSIGGIRPFPPEFLIYRDRNDDGSDYCGYLPRRFLRDESSIDRSNLTVLHVSQGLELCEFTSSTSFVGPDYRVVVDDDAAECADDVVPSMVNDPIMSMYLETYIASVVPRKIGTFVTSVTTYNRNDGKCVAKSWMVALISGLDPCAVIPFGVPNPTRRRADEGGGGGTVHDVRRMGRNDRFGDVGRADDGDDDVGAIDETTNTTTMTTPITTTASEMITTIVRYRIPKNAALLYRLSGDYNPIHVEGIPPDGVYSRYRRRSDDDGKVQRRPVLHGLCTMGYALRAVLDHVHRRHRSRLVHPRGGGSCERRNESMRLSFVRCDFVGPVFPKDVLRVEVRDYGWTTRCSSCDNVDVMTALDVRFRVFRGRRRGEGAMEIDGRRRDVAVVDNGRAEFCLVGSGSDVVDAVCRL